MSAARSRLTLLPTPLHCSQAEAVMLLKRQLFEDAVAAGWLAPCARKKSARGKDSIFYRTNDVMEVSARIVGGEYPAEPGMTKPECRMTNDGRRSA